MFAIKILVSGIAFSHNISTLNVTNDITDIPQVGVQLLEWRVTEDFREWQRVQV